MQTSPAAQTTIRNHTQPELQSGSPTDRQIGRERAVLFYHFLYCMGIPQSTINFIFAIYNVSGKPGQPFYLDDNSLAIYLVRNGRDGSPSPHYVRKLRKQLKAWNTGEYLSGQRHYSFVSVIENFYNPKTKRQIPTGYEFSAEFAEYFERLVIKLRQHRRYQFDWCLAIKELLESESKSELLEFGYYKERKQKRPRSLEQILGTMLLNLKHVTQNIINTGVAAGFDPAEIAAWVKDIFPQYVDHAAAIEQNAIGSISAAIKHGRGDYTDKDFPGFISRVVDYVELRDGKDPAAVPVEYKKTTGDKNNDSGNARSLTDNEIWGTDRGHSDQLSKLAANQANGSMRKKADRSSMDQSRIRFLEKIAVGSGSEKQQQLSDQRKKQMDDKAGG